MSQKTKKMNCCPNCTYFPNMDCKSYKLDNLGVKRRTDGKQFICGYDGHIIISWYAECPKEKDAIEIMAEREKKKAKDKKHKN